MCQFMEIYGILRPKFELLGRCMKKGRVKLLAGFVRLIFVTSIISAEFGIVANTNIDQKMVHVYKLENGLTVLVRPLHTTPNVCTQLWYKVGSKNEKTNQKGIAHLIEHMVFKGSSGPDSLKFI